MTTTGMSVQLIPGFQECDEDGWQSIQKMLNDDEIVTSVQAESDPVDDETDCLRVSIAVGVPWGSEVVGGVLGWAPKRTHGTQDKIFLRGAPYDISELAPFLTLFHKLVCNGIIELNFYPL
ncbi:hypothetical protein TNCV_1878291 [Trichonephila clavipes]|nr:hypothetical protein TNCV_1878291 [Trichonephila clavipes]